MPPRAAWSTGTPAIGFCARCGSATGADPRRLGAALPRLRAPSISRAPIRSSSCSPSMSGARPRRPPAALSGGALFGARGLPRGRRIARGSGRARAVRGGRRARDGGALRRQPALAVPVLADDRLHRAPWNRDAITLDTNELEHAMWVSRGRGGRRARRRSRRPVHRAAALMRSPTPCSSAGWRAPEPDPRQLLSRPRR